MSTQNEIIKEAMSVLGKRSAEKSRMGMTDEEYSEMMSTRAKAGLKKRWANHVKKTTKKA